MLNAFRSSTSTYSTLRLLQWLWNILRHHRLQTGLNTLLGCSTVLLDFMFIAATKWTIDIATYKAPGSLSIAAALLIGILLSQLCIHFASRWVKAILGVKAQNHMQRFYLDRRGERRHRNGSFHYRRVHTVGRCVLIPVFHGCFIGLSHHGHHSALHGIEQGLYETYAQTDPRNQEYGQPYPKHTARNDTTPDGCTDLGATVRYGTTVR